MRKFIITAELRDITDRWDNTNREDSISYSKMVEILNEKALKYAQEYADSKLLEIDLSGILTNFQIFLNDKKLIDNHSFDYEKESKKFIKKYKLLPPKK